MRSLLVAALGGCGDAARGDDTAAAEAVCTASTGDVTGTVLQEVGGDTWAPVPGARVVITNEALETLETRADAEGRYTLTREAGDWTVWATNDDGSCRTAELTEVALTACGVVEADLFMDLWAGWQGGR